MIFRSDLPVKGYPFYSFRSFSHYGKAANVIDNMPENLTYEYDDIFFMGYLPSICASCDGKGCSKCSSYGYLFEKLNDKVKISDIYENFNK